MKLSRLFLYRCRFGVHQGFQAQSDLALKQLRAMIQSLLLVCFTSTLNAQTQESPHQENPDDIVPTLRDYNPVSQLKVTSTLLTQAKWPVVDVHTHFFYKLRHNEEALDDFV